MTDAQSSARGLSFINFSRVKSEFRHGTWLQVCKNNHSSSRVHPATVFSHCILRLALHPTILSNSQVPGVAETLSCLAIASSGVRIYEHHLLSPITWSCSSCPADPSLCPSSCTGWSPSTQSDTLRAVVSRNRYVMLLT